MYVCLRLAGYLSQRDMGVCGSMIVQEVNISPHN